jgi:hypothetical protein
MSNDNWDAILSLNADAYSFATTIAAKSMLSQFLLWENSVPAESRNERCAIVGDSAKRVSLWHEKVLMPRTLRLQCNLYQNPPYYARQVLQDRKLREIEVTRNNIFELHVQLLVAASESLVSCLREGLGDSTKTQIEGWFQLMARIEVRPSPNNLISKTSAGTQISFLQVLDDYGEELRRVNGAGGEERSATEYMYFDHKILFLHIAHMVFFTCVETKSRQPHVKECQMVVSNLMFEEWEQLSGEFSNRRLKLSENGLLIDGAVGSDHAFALIVLPRNWFRKQTKAGLPSIHRLHKALMNMMIGKIHQMQAGRNIGSHENHEAQKLAQFFTDTFVALESYVGVLTANEKARRNFRRNGLQKKGPSYRYKSRDPNKFQRDMFIFGQHSYHYLFSTRMGQAYREMICYMPEDRVEVVVPEEDPYLLSRNGIIDALMNDGLEDDL